MLVLPQGNGLTAGELADAEDPHIRRRTIPDYHQYSGRKLLEAHHGLMPIQDSNQYHIQLILCSLLNLYIIVNHPPPHPSDPEIPQWN